MPELHEYNSPRVKPINSTQHTCKRPFSSRSPLNFTKTISSSERRTRSKGSDTGAKSPSAVSAIFFFFKYKIFNDVVEYFGKHDDDPDINNCLIIRIIVTP